MSVIELNKILEEKTIDKSEIGKDPLPYIACPKCGSENLERNKMTDYHHDEIYYMITCKDCGWSNWTQ